MVHACEDLKAESTSAMEHITKKTLPAIMKDVNIFLPMGLGTQRSHIRYILM